MLTFLWLKSFHLFSVNTCLFLCILLSSLVNFLLHTSENKNLRQAGRHL